jgi:glutathione S-transferase
MRSYSEGARIGLPIGLAMKTAAPVIAISARVNEASGENAQAALRALPALLDRVDGYIADGTIGGAEPNAADFQIATSIGLAMTMADLRPAIEGRPAGGLAAKIVPDYPGHTPPIFPAAWLDPLRGAPVGP